MDDLRIEIKSWLASVFSNENIADFTLEIEGNSEKGDGYMGDVIFVRLFNKKEILKEYNLVLKCGKRSEALRAQAPVRQAFQNEIYIYDVVFPAFTKFQQEKGMTEVFNSVPKCYGTLTTKNMEVIVLQNLKKIGYDLWDRRKPVTSNHINMVVELYGKWHAISAAMRDQEPIKFEEISNGVLNLWPDIAPSMDIEGMLENCLADALDLLRDELDENSITQVERLKNQVRDIIKNISTNSPNFSVITHGDCWTNNFMYKYESEGNLPSNVAILDWQISNLSHPVYDLSYFLYACSSKEDLDNFDEILKRYHRSFSSYVRQLGSDPEKLYPLSQLLKDWNVIAKFGIVISILLIKISLTAKEDVRDVGEAAENGLVSEAFKGDIKDKDAFKARVRYILAHAIKRGITAANI